MLLQKVAVKHSSYYFEISCHKGSKCYFFSHFCTLKKAFGQAKFRPREILFLLDIEETPGVRVGVQIWLAKVLFDFTTYHLIVTFHLQPSKAVKTILQFLECIPG